MLVGLDLGFGYTKTVTPYGPDAFPSVVGDWTPAAFRIGGRLDHQGDEALVVESRPWLVGDRALRVGHRQFVGLSREWMTTLPYRVLALAALRRCVPPSDRSVILVTGLPVEDFAPHAEAVRRQLTGTHTLETRPAGEHWTITVREVHVVPQPLGTVLAEVLDDTGTVRNAEAAAARIGVLDIGFRTTDYFTLEGFEVLPAQCLTRNTGMADLLLDLSREVYRRWGVELDPHALDAPALSGTLQVAGRPVSLAPILAPLLDRHAEAIAAHARMLWGDEARTLGHLWLTGGGAQILKERLLPLAPHAQLVANARIQNAVGYYRYGRRLLQVASSATPAGSR